MIAALNEWGGFGPRHPNMFRMDRYLKITDWARARYALRNVDRRINLPEDRGMVRANFGKIEALAWDRIIKPAPTSWTARVDVKGAWQ